MLLFYTWIFFSLCHAKGLEPRSPTSSCSVRLEHEESTLLQGWVAPKSKPQPVVLIHEKLTEPDMMYNETIGANATVAIGANSTAGQQVAIGGVISIKLDSELQVSAVQAASPASRLEAPSTMAGRLPLSFLATAIDLVKASAADTSPHPTGTEAIAAASIVSAHAAASRIAAHPVGLSLVFSDSSLPALIHKTALAQFFLCRAWCLKYDPWRSDALLIMMIIIFVALLCGGLLMFCMRYQRPNMLSNYPPRLQGSAWVSASNGSRPQEQTSPKFSPPAPVAGHTTFGSTMSSPPATGWQSHLSSSSFVGGPGSLNADLVLPLDKEVLLAVPSLVVTPESDKLVEHAIANKEGAPILRVSMSRKMEGASIREHLAICLWEDGIQLAFCELWPERLRMSPGQGSPQDVVVGSIFRATGELYANITRQFATGVSGLPVGEFIVNSPTGVQWQHRMQSKGRDLMIMDMSGRVHGMVMAGGELSFEHRNVQYYQLHALAGTDVCLLLMTVMSIDRLTLLSKE